MHSISAEEEMGGPRLRSSQMLNRVRSRLRRIMSSRLCRRNLRLQNSQPLISFSFDDFPRSAFLTGARILADHGISGTYYTSFGLMGETAPTGEIFLQEDLPLVLQ